MHDTWTARGLADLSASQSAFRHPAGAEARAAAALALHRVRDRGQSLTRVLQTPQSSSGSADQALIQELCYGVLRMLPRLEALAARLLKRPLKKNDRDLDALILLGLYQLLAMNTPAHAAVAATVEASRLLGKPDKAALVNALLRRFLRERESLLAEVDQDPAIRWLFPDWLLTRLRADWPDDWERIVEASNARPPMSLRVNRTRLDREDYAQRLAAAGLGVQPIDGCEMGLMLDQPCPTRDLPGFAEGLVSVQDGGAQLAAQLLDAQPGQRVLDACAAPGGKTAAILERAGNALDLVALDSDATRLKSVHATLTRLGLSAQVVAGDASRRQATGPRDPSTASCWMSPARPPASSAVILTSSGSSAPTTSRPLPPCRRACWTPSGPCSRPAVVCSMRPARCWPTRITARSRPFSPASPRPASCRC